MDFWIGGLLILSSEKAKMHGIGWKYKKRHFENLDCIIFCNPAIHLSNNPWDYNARNY